MTWNADLYRERHAFVWRGGAGILEWLQPQAGETVVDLGCGSGELTAQIAASGARVIGLDRAPEMVAAARERFAEIEFREADATTFRLEEPVDAVFSNATLHWVKDAGAAAARIRAALKPGGRFVAELGGQGNVASIERALRGARAALQTPPAESPWFFPSLGEYADVLEAAGLRVVRAELFERPTKLEGEDGLQAWLVMFGAAWLADLTPDLRAEVAARVEKQLRPQLFAHGAWQLDYVRLRVLAHHHEM